MCVCEHDYRSPYIVFVCTCIYVCVCVFALCLLRIVSLTFQSHIPFS